MQMHWTYGLLQEKDKIVLVEVYWEQKLRPWGYAYATPKKEDIPLIKKDINDQLTHFRVWRLSDIKKSNKRIISHS